MSSTVDVNVLLYASDGSSPFHRSASELLHRLADGPELVYFFWPVLMGYLRLSTHPAVFPRPLSMQDAMSNVEELVELPHARVPGESEGFWRAYESATSGILVTGNLVSDAHLVTLMRENGVASVWSHDRDLRKFEGITVRDPFA